MSNPLRILDEDRMERDDVCSFMGWEPVTFYRHLRRGLEHLRTGPGRGAKVLTSRQALERYLARLNGIESDGTDAVEEVPARRTKRREAELASVDRELAALGI